MAYGKLIQVSAKRNYYEEAYKAWRKKELEAQDPPATWPLNHLVKVLEEVDDDAGDVRHGGRVFQERPVPLPLGVEGNKR